MEKKLDGTIVSWNKAAENLYGYSEEEAINANIKMLFPENKIDEFKEIIDNILQNQPIKSFETVRIRRDKTIIPVSLTIAPIKNKHGEIVGATTTSRILPNKN